MGKFAGKVFRERASCLKRDALWLLLALLACAQPALSTTAQMEELLSECECDLPLAEVWHADDPGMALVLDGYSEEGLLELEWEIQSETDPELREKRRMQYAVALFHVGTAHNCVADSERGKCAFPILPGEEHSDQEMYRRSVQAFAAMIDNEISGRLATQDRRSRRTIASKCANFMLAFTANQTLVEPLSSLLWARNRIASYSVAYALAENVSPSPIAGSSTTSGIFFEDVAPQMHMDLLLPAAAFGTADFDEDGLIDVILCGWLDSYNLEIRMNALDSFELREGAPLGVERLRGGSKITVGDVNNDGHVDLFVTRGSWRLDMGAVPPNSLLMGHGNGTFEDRTIEAGLVDPRWGAQPSLFLDWDLDGWADIVVCNEQSKSGHRESIQLFINNGDGTFTDRWHEVGYSFSGWCRAVVQVDANNDPYPDIAVSDFMGFHVVVIENPGGGSTSSPHSTSLSLIQMFRRSVSPFTMASADLDNDGVQELVITTSSRDLSGPDFFIMKVNGDGLHLWFTASGLQTCATCSTQGSAMGLAITDADNDGWLDIAVGTGAAGFEDVLPDRLFRNIVPQSRSASFVDVSLEPDVKFADVLPGHTICSFDYDNDGDLDLLKSIGGKYDGDAARCALLRNGASERLRHNKWLSIKLIGTRSNRDAIGAKVEVRAHLADGSSQSMFRWVQQSSSFGCEQERVHVGLGLAESIEYVRVFWPFLDDESGLVTESFYEIEMNTFIVIREGAERVEYVQY